MTQKKSEYNLGADHLIMNVSKIVTLKQYFTIMTEDGPVDITTTITADFEQIPDKYHEVSLNLLTSKYLNKVSFGDNPFSQCRPYEKKKWFQFWK
jgi:hypothetical protein